VNVNDNYTQNYTQLSHVDYFLFFKTIFAKPQNGGQSRQSIETNKKNGAILSGKADLFSICQ
jgi:hypothetical protein